MIMLMEITIYVALLLLGLVFGSYASATVWRLRARQLVEDKAQGEEVNDKEYRQLKTLAGRSFKEDRSQCLRCGHELRWYDLIPLVSWVSMGGKCRYCRKPIGWAEPIIEGVVALLFLLSYIFWPFQFVVFADVCLFILWLTVLVLLAILFLYDLRWYLLPDRVVYPLIAVSACYALISVFIAGDFAGAVASLLLSLVILSGIYLALWLFSKGRWIGFGDVKLGFALGLLLGEWPLALMTLILANLIGCLIVLPGMMAGKIGRKTHVPFGPLLITGALITMLWGREIVGWYLVGLV